MYLQIHSPQDTLHAGSFSGVSLSRKYLVSHSRSATLVFSCLPAGGVFVDVAPTSVQAADQIASTATAAVANCFDAAAGRQLVDVIVGHAPFSGQERGREGGVAIKRLLAA